MRKQKYVTPSGLEFTLREQTGADDEILNAAQDETVMINSYLANVIEEGPGNKRFSAEDVKKLRLGDKYFLVVSSRILSLGNILYFQYQWDPNEASIEYEEDLSRYVWDYSEPFPEVGDPLYFDQRFQPYPAEEFIEGQVGDYKLRMDYLDGAGEAYMLKLPANSRTVNQELRARNLRFFDTEWKIVKTFTSFTARDMVYIRNLAHEGDPAIEGLTTVTHPGTGESLALPLLGIKDFFYPVKI